MTNDPLHDPDTDTPFEDENPLAAELLLAELEQARAELEQLRAESLRERAELDNQRKRLARDIENARKYANERLLADLLPVFDSLEAALANAPENDPLRDGAELTLRQLHRVAESSGLVEVAPAAGDSFTPEHHQAVSVIEVEGIPPGTVARVFQKGYVLNERLLRPAMVVVASQD